MRNEDIDLFDEDEDDGPKEDEGDYDESEYHEGTARDESADHAGVSGDDLPNEAFMYPEDGDQGERGKGDIKL